MCCASIVVYILNRQNLIWRKLVYGLSTCRFKTVTNLGRFYDIDGINVAAGLVHHLYLVAALPAL